MHIWLADSEFPDILRARQLTGYWHTHSREKTCPVWEMSEDKSWLMTAPMLMDSKHITAYRLGYGRGWALKHLLCMSILHT